MPYDPLPFSGSRPAASGIGPTGTLPSSRPRAGLPVRRALAILMGGAVLAGGCASPGAGGSNPGAAPDVVTLDVTNGDVSDVRLYLVYDDVPVRLGVVEGDESSTFRVPVGQLHGGGEVRLAGRLVPSRQTFLSEPLVLDDGDRLKVRIEDNPNVSALQIRQR